MASNVIGAFSREAVEEFSRSKGEPEWMREKRLQAWDVYEAMPAPLGRRGDLGTLRAFSNFSFQQLTPSGTGRGEQRRPQGAPRDRTWEEQRHPQGAPNHIRPTPASDDEGALP